MDRTIRLGSSTGQAREGVGAHDRVGRNATNKQRIEQTEDDMRTGREVYE